MASSNDLDAALTLSRFGLGAADGSLAAIQGNPRDALREEIAERYVPVPVGAALGSSAALLVSLYAFQDQEKAERERQAAAASPPGASPPAAPAAMMRPDAAAMAPPAPATLVQPGTSAPPAMAAAPPPPRAPYLPQQVLLAEAEARFNGTIHEPLIGFGERLAMFWANHFAVAIGKGQDVHVLAGAFEREAIRPNVFGRFADMLQAVETHPAMLMFLDNQQSVGPDSRAGNNGKRGLNENLARETLELHTLGVDGGYTQQDVTALARIITGWTVNRKEGPLGAPGTFAFNPGAHQPGDQTLLGLTYADAGLEQGRMALRDLARHPATARHLATKLTRHFVADAAPPDLVARLAAAYTKSDGDLSAVYLALIGSEEAWDPRLVKIRSPLDYVVALLRASGERPKPNLILSALTAMGQPLWNPAGPNGFADTTDAWASSEGLGTRIDVASLIANAASNDTDPRRFASERLGLLLTPETLQAIARASTKAQGLSIAFLSPEFQRR
jgi:uncharacterized protein (DUF1800 family)